VETNKVAHDPSQYSPVFRIDVSAEQTPAGPPVPNDAAAATVALLRQLVISQEKQNQLLEQLVQNTVNVQKQRASELQQWKDANPRLAKSCRRAAETLSKVQSEFLEKLTDEILDNEETLMDGEFMLSEFVDRFGPRMAHLNGILQVLAQLGSGVPA
jgi:exonuclease VII large subunit